MARREANAFDLPLRRSGRHLELMKVDPQDVNPDAGLDIAKIDWTLPVGSTTSSSCKARSLRI
jgi:hypothetical protein